MRGYNNRMRATDRFLARYLGRSKPIKPDEFSSQITQPLDRDIAKLIRPCLTEFRYFLPQDARELAAVREKDFEVPIYYQAGFGCKVFVADYQPKRDSSGQDEDMMSLPLLANPPRHGCSCRDSDCQCENKDYADYLRRTSVLHEPLQNPSKQGDISS